MNKFVVRPSEWEIPRVPLRHAIGAFESVKVGDRFELIATGEVFRILRSFSVKGNDLFLLIRDDFEKLVDAHGHTTVIIALASEVVRVVEVKKTKVQR